MKMEEFLRNIGVGIRPIDDPFFENSHRVCKIFQRKGVTVEEDEELCHEIIREFPCYAAGCKAVFQTLIDFEMHYNSTHRYVCVECRKSMPNPRLLDIHIQETHDNFFRVLSTKQPMYQCYVSECDLKFNDSVERRNHCVHTHKFPKNFRFDNAATYKKHEPQDKMEVDKIIPKCTKPKSKIQLNKNQRVRMFTAESKSTVLHSPKLGMIQSSSTDSGKKVPSLHFIPRQVQKSYTKALTNNQTNERNVLETENMMDLAEMLPK